MKSKDNTKDKFGAPREHNQNYIELKKDVDEWRSANPDTAWLKPQQFVNLFLDEKWAKFSSDDFRYRYDKATEWCDMKNGEGKG